MTVGRDYRLLFCRWFDLDTLENFREMLQGGLDHDGIKESVHYVEQLIDKEVAAGISPDRIVVAGFSQGGHVALKTVLQSKIKLAGCIAMSTWLEPFAFEVTFHRHASRCANESCPELLPARACILPHFT